MLIDIIQKCVIINASLNDLHGGSLINSSNRDISIQPYATSSILQHHYQASAASAAAAAAAALAGGNEFGSRVGANNQSSDNGTAGSQLHNRTDLTDNGPAGASTITDTTSAKSGTGIPDGGQVSDHASSCLIHTLSLSYRPHLSHASRSQTAAFERKESQPRKIPTDE